MQDLTAGMLRKAALVKRQTLSQRELVVGNSWRLDSSPASVTGPGAAVVRWGMLCLSLWVSLECPCSFSVDGDSFKFLTEQGSSHHPGPAEGLGSCTEQLCPTWHQGRCTNVELFHHPWNPQSSSSVICVFSSHHDGNGLERFCVLTYQTA